MSKGSQIKNQVKKQEEAKTVHVRDAQVANMKMRYFSNLTEGMYLKERCNMMALQLNSGKIEEEISGVKKTEALLYQEYLLTKNNAINHLNMAAGIKNELLTTPQLKTTDADLEAFQKECINKKMTGVALNDTTSIDKKAKFVKED